MELKKFKSCLDFWGGKDNQKTQLLENINLDNFHITESLSLIIAKLYYYEKRAMSKEFLYKIIKSLPNTNKIEMFVFQLAHDESELNCEEVKKMLELIDDTYAQLCTIVTSPINLEKNQNIETLLQVLKEKECISSYSVKDDKIIVYRFKK